MSSNNRDYISCRNPATTKQQEAGWNRMVRDLEHRKAKENHRKEVKPMAETHKGFGLLLKWDVERR